LNAQTNYSDEFLGEASLKKGAVPPYKLAKESEHSHQVALMAWASLPDVLERFPELKWLHAIGNGGSRGDTDQSRRIEGGKMKAEGVKRGVSDLCLPVKRGGWSGFYIELKKMPGKGVGPSEEQLEFGEFVRAQGFAFMVAYGWREARDAVIAYLTQEW
jgi:hypothetical protein